MIKITDADYRLPIIQALVPLDTFETSANKPILISGVDADNGERGEYVVKFKRAERMSEEACMRELLASFIALQMEIPVVMPAIVNIIPPFVETLKGKDIYSVAAKSLGYNYGSDYIRTHSTIPTNQSLNNHQLEFAQTIFCFDVFIQNTDRTQNKPNMITDGKEIVILDHEIAFGFVFDFAFAQNPQAWVIREQDMQWVNQHVLLSKIKGQAYDYNIFLSKLGNLDNAFWGRAFELIPAEWRNEQFDRIKAFLTSICDHKEEFIVELKKLML
jgi:hypothetical protein